MAESECLYICGCGSFRWIPLPATSTMHTPICHGSMQPTHQFREQKQQRAAAQEQLQAERKARVEVNERLIEQRGNYLNTLNRAEAAEASLAAERKAREEANSAYDVINRAWKEMKERAEAAEAKLENPREVVAAAKQLRKEFGSESDRGVCRVFDAAIDAARKERK